MVCSASSSRLRAAVPHVIPYQGSKRLLAPALLPLLPRAERLFEPFAGSAALALAALSAGHAQHVVLGDSYAPLVSLWQAIVDAPAELAGSYASLWHDQQADPAAHYLAVRSQFATAPTPAALLYLLARCVKNAPRWNTAGQFNQSADHRRRGTHPDRQRAQILAASRLLRGRCTLRCGDAAATTADATAADAVYLDPPWQGTTEGRDRRYHAGLARSTLIDLLTQLQARNVAFLLSYDGALHDEAGQVLQRYGAELPVALGCERRDVVAGRSAQATLSGQRAVTVESVYLWPATARKDA